MIRALSVILLFTATLFGREFLTFEGTAGKAGNGKHVVLLAGDHEYRSEEYLPMLAQILSQHHGFKTTVLFAENEAGEVDPASNLMPGLELLKEADAMILGLRFRDWSEEDFFHFDAALQAGVPIISTRTTTHAFKATNKEWSKFNFNSKAKGWKGGFGRQVLGETWVCHHGNHGKEGTLAVAENGEEEHQILRGIREITTPTDVYGANPLNPETILLRGLVTDGMTSDAKPLQGEKNNPAMPVAWTKLYQNTSGKTNKVFTTTLGSGIDFLDEDLRRLIINATYWATELKVPEKAEVGLVSRYEPSHFKSGKWRIGLKPADFTELVDPKFTIPFFPEGKEPNSKETSKVELKNGQHIALIGGGLFSRMMKFNEFETEMHLRYPQHDLVFRNQADEGNTPAYRPHPSKDAENHYAFPGAKQLVPIELQRGRAGEGHREGTDAWLSKVKADIVIAGFGSNEHFRGEAGLAGFKAELQGLIDHTKTQNYNGEEAPQLILVTPTAFEDLSDTYDVPDGEKENENLALYSQAIIELAAENNLPSIDLFTPTRKKFAQESHLTRDGALLNREGYRYIANQMAGVFSSPLLLRRKKSLWEQVLVVVTDKNWHWHNLFKMPNGIHVEGRRHNPYGPANYPYEIRKLEQMVHNRDQLIHATVKGKKFDLTGADEKTEDLPEVESNFNTKSEKFGSLDFMSGEESVSTFSLPEGYRAELFASESQFPNLANPCQLSFDAKGRLWVGVMPSYPHWKPGDVKPTDKLLIYEDTDGDGRADTETVFSDQLHLMPGFELSTNKLGQQEVYVSQVDSLVLLTDTDGDDVADQKEVIMSGFDDYDSHHAISAFCADPGGGIVMGEGVFLMSSVETAYGVVRGHHGGFMRYDPNRRHLERTTQDNFPNPWGTVFDAYGQPFALHTSGPNLAWLIQTAQKPIFGYNTVNDTILESNEVRPTSGLEILSSRHFPDEVQGDLILGNVIGFLGIKQHRVMESGGANFKTEYRQDLLSASDPNVRLSDLEIAPDGSLFVLDWHNPLIGHMQHNARDPKRDHVHGRIFRITYPSRELVEPAEIDGASVETLLANLTLPELRTRYRTRRELRSRATEDVMPKLKKWASEQSDERLKLEALWVSWGLNSVDRELLGELRSSGNHRIRAAVMMVLHYNLAKFPNYLEMLIESAQDPHARVRLMALNTATRLPQEEIQEIHETLVKQELPQIFENPMAILEAHLEGGFPNTKPKQKYPAHIINSRDRERFLSGQRIYHKEGFCITCHQQDGRGIPSAQFPPLRGSEWIQDDRENLIKIILNGVSGPITVKDAEYNSVMMGFAPLMTDKKISDVIYFITNSWDKPAFTISADEVAKVRAENKERITAWTVEELLGE